jgi:hypothetical protein
LIDYYVYKKQLENIVHRHDVVQFRHLTQHKEHENHTNRVKLRALSHIDTQEIQVCSDTHEMHACILQDIFTTQVVHVLQKCMFNSRRDVYRGYTCHAYALSYDYKLSVGEEFLFVFVISAQVRCSSCASKNSAFLMWLSSIAKK